jgi:hypothetical protein
MAHNINCQAKPNATIPKAPATRNGPLVIIGTAAPLELVLETPPPDPDPDPDPVAVGAEVLIEVLVYVSFCAKYSNAIPMIGANDPSGFIMGMYSVVL